jgi:hypothetical protein
MNENEPDKRQKAKEEERRKRAEVADELVRTLADDAPRESEPWWSYYYVVKYLGGEQARQVVREAIDVEARGGMTTSDGTRKRTLGGVFFALVRKKLGKKTMLSVRQRVAWKTGIPLPSKAPKPSPTPPKTAPLAVPQSETAASPMASPKPTRATAPNATIAPQRVALQASAVSKKAPTAATSKSDRTASTPKRKRAGPPPAQPRLADMIEIQPGVMVRRPATP